MADRGGRKFRISESDQAEMLRLFLEEKQSARKLGKKYNIGHRAILAYLRRNGADENLIKSNTNSLKDLTGKKLGKLTVICIDEAGTKKTRNKKVIHWKCVCECGTEVVVSQQSLNRVKRPTTSCGCLKISASYKGYESLSGSYFQRIEERAQKKAIEFNIDIVYLWNLFIEQNGKCALSGIDINLSKTRKIYQSASLDRKNSLKGYVEGNVQWVHKDINMMKWILTEERFIYYCKLVANQNL